MNHAHPHSSADSTENRAKQRFALYEYVVLTKTMTLIGLIGHAACCCA